MNNTSLNIIQMAFDSLENNPIFKGIWKYVIESPENRHISLYARDKAYNFVPETRQEVRKQQIPAFIKQAGQQTNLLIIAGKIYPDAKEILRAHGIAYLEGNGNIYLQKDDFFVWIDSNKSLPFIKGKTNRAFTKTGLKVVFHLLMNENFLNIPYREIAQLTGTSLGNVTNVMNGLKAMDYLIQGENGAFKLINKKLLLDKWVNAYEQLLKPALEIGTFRFINQHDHETWRRVPLENKRSLWGAEAGAHLLTGKLRPYSLVIYTSESRNDLINQYRLVRDTNGYIKIYEKFWNYDDYRSNVAPPLLIYADLLQIGNTETLDLSERIYEEYVKDKIEEKVSAFVKNR